MTTTALVRDATFGRKHTCGDCGTRFYDLNKPEPVCPKCGSRHATAGRPPTPVFDPVVVEPEEEVVRRGRADEEDEDFSLPDDLDLDAIDLDDLDDDEADDGDDDEQEEDVSGS